MYHKTKIYGIPCKEEALGFQMRPFMGDFGPTHGSA